MADENFVDYVKIYLRSGHGGAGSMHFRREKFIPKGGPDGGNGGRGGHVILRGNRHLWTLLHLKFQKHIFAESGEAGSGSNSTGADGKDVYVEVPLGTVAKDAETGEFLMEITEHNQECIIKKGGRGGMGNSHFKTATQQAPRFAQPGGDEEEGWTILELKLLADVGLVGFPNAGKSTLLTNVSAAKPKVADYAFTTLTPKLGLVRYYDNLSFVMADIPGIIEGASEGKGLGLRFLRHIERNSLLLFLIPSDSKNILKEYNILLGELKKYNPELLDKKRIIAISKSDLIDSELRELILKEMKELQPIFFSSHTKDGIPQLKDLIWKELSSDSY